jgi:hypothetical protein
MNSKHAIVAATLFVGSSLTHAATIYSDNFNSYPRDGINWSPPASSGWRVGLNGTVDLIGSGGGHDLVPGRGGYVDLDGNTLNSGLLSHSFFLNGGTTYTASFALAGSHRGSAETAQVHFGGSAASYSLNSAEPFQTFNLNFTPSINGSYSLSFLNAGGDNIGILLDNVAVRNNLPGFAPDAAMASAVPEPEIYAMLMAGLGLLGLLGRRRMS